MIREMRLWLAGTLGRGMERAISAGVIKIAIIVGTTRPGRKALAVAQWVHELARTRTDAEFEIVDIQDFNLPLLDEPTPPSAGKYTKDHTKAWSAKIDPFDGFVFVTPEYNRGPAAALKNALDFLYREWTNKAAGFVSYGGPASGARAIEQLRQVVGELQIADVRSSVCLSLSTDFEAYTTLKPAERHTKSLATMLDQVVAWSGALKPLRAK